MKSKPLPNSLVTAGSLAVLAETAGAATTVDLTSLKWQAGCGGSGIGAGVTRWVAVFDIVG